jgi:hypothetical protein
MKWPMWLPFLGFRRRDVGRCEAFELGVRPGTYDLFEFEWLGAGIIFGLSPAR